MEQSLLFRLKKTTKKGENVVSEILIDLSQVSQNGKNNINIKKNESLYIKQMRDVLRLKNPSNTYLNKPILDTCLTLENKKTKELLKENNNHFKFGLYIKNNNQDFIIIEREFSVDGYNPKTLYSSELCETLLSICNDIKEQIIEKDKIMVFEDLNLLYWNSKLSEEDVYKMNQEERQSKLKKYGVIN